MRSVIFIFMFLLIQAITLSQPCLPDGITFGYQSAIDNFQSIYPNCTEIGGDVIILGDGITNLNGLSPITSIDGSLIMGTKFQSGPNISSLTGLENLTFIGGNLQIMGNSVLTSLEGLENVSFIGGYLWFAGNPDLTNLTGLENLFSIGGYFKIEYNHTLTSMTGLEELTSIGEYLCIHGNNDLYSLSGLNNIKSIGSNLVIMSNDELINLSGLENLTTLSGGYLQISGNGALTSLTGLENLTSVRYGLNIDQNKSLTSLMGLENLTTIGTSLHISGNKTLTSLKGIDNIEGASFKNLYIYHNSLLCTCDVRSICDYLAGPGGSSNIKNNAFGCNSQEEIEAACDAECLYDGITFSTQAQIDSFPINFPNCTEIEGNVSISGDNITNLNGLSVLTSIGGYLAIQDNYALSSLTGLDNVTSIGGWLGIVGHDGLTSLTGLNNIEAASIDSLYIFMNMSLSTCEVKSVCDYLISPNGIIEIHDNATGCNNQIEVESACASSIGEYNNSFGITIQPTPFTTSTNLSYTLDKPNNVQITIYTLQGQIVFMMEEKQKTGTQRVEWNAEGLPPGLYIIRLQAGNNIAFSKLLLAH